jgi:two-component system cell cycle response regulator
MRALRKASAVAVVTVIGAGTIAIASAGIGAWLAAVLASGILGGLATLMAVGISGASRSTPAPVEQPLGDPVTGLPNVDKLQRDLERRLTSPTDDSGTVLYLCLLHGLKQYNDAYGEACGDAMLAWLARKLREAVDDRGRVYRMRGGMFAVLARGTEHPTDLRAKCSAALLEVGEGFMISSAVGEAVLGEDGATAAGLVELASRRAHAAQSYVPGDYELRPPEDPMEVLPLERPRFDVTTLATRIGRRMDVPSAQLEDLEAAAHLRDVGNMALPAAVLSRPGRLPGHEWEFIKLHTIVGERLLAVNFGMEAVAKLVRSSHERWDGSGYPDGLEAERIPLGSRILFVCSAFQDMTSARPHRRARTTEEALVELELGAATQFDPDVIRAFAQEFAVADDATATAADAGRPLRVLIADDDAASRFLLHRAIDAAGHKCVGVEDGASAWELYRCAEPDLVICDSRLPKMGADELCRHIREEAEDPNAYFVTLVALEDGELVRRGMVAGADDFLTKPFDREDLELMLAEAAKEIALRRDDQ